MRQSIREAAELSRPYRDPTPFDLDDQRSLENHEDLVARSMRVWGRIDPLVLRVVEPHLQPLRSPTDLVILRLAPREQRRELWETSVVKTSDVGHALTLA